MKTRKLFFCHLGNGLSVCDTLHEKHGDYEKIAHINRNRTIKYYVNLKPEYIQEIEHVAKTNNCNISTTQDVKIFSVPPMV
jgi:hypothetical protein